MRQDHAGASDHVRQRHPERPALYFTVLGEPAIKMLRYQQQFTFFDHCQAGRQRSASSTSARSSWTRTSARSWMRSSRRSRRPSASIVVVDSFRTVVRKALGQRERSGTPGLRPAPGAAPDQLAGHHVPDRRVRRGRAARQPGLHRGRRAVLALPERRAQLDRAQDAGHEAARPGVRARPAHLPHHRRRPANLPAHLRPHRRSQATSRAGGVFPPASANSTR